MKNTSRRDNYFQKVLISFFCIILLFFIHSNVLYAKEIIVGVVFSGRIDSYFDTHRGFIEKIKKRRDIRIRFIYQKPMPDPLAWANAVRKLLAYDSEIIIAYGSGATKAALYEVTGVPVIGVFVSEDTFTRKDYPKLALVEYRFPATSIIRYAKDIGISSRIGILEDISEPSSTIEAEAISKVASRVGVEDIRLKVSNKRELDMRLKLFRYSSLVVTNSALIIKNLPQYRDFILKERVPVIGVFGENKSLSLISFKPDTGEMAEGLYEVFMEVLQGRYVTKKVYRTNIIYNLALSRKLKIQPSVKLITVADEVLK